MNYKWKIVKIQTRQMMGSCLSKMGRKTDNGFLRLQIGPRWTRLERDKSVQGDQLNRANL